MSTEPQLAVEERLFQLLQDIQGAQARRAVHLFESNRLRPDSTRRIRQMIHAYRH